MHAGMAHMIRLRAAKLFREKTKNCLSKLNCSLDLNLVLISTIYRIIENTFSFGCDISGIKHLNPQQ